MAFGTKLDLGTLMVNVVANTALFEKAMHRSNKTLEAFGKKWKRAGEQFSKVGAKMTLAITAPFAILSSYAIKSLAQFDQAMAESTAIFINATQSMKNNMRSLAEEMSVKWAVAADKAAKGFFYLGSAGLNAKQSLMAYEHTLKFAKAGTFEISTAVDLATDSLSAMGLESKNSAVYVRNLKHVMDVLAKSNIISNATIEQFASALTRDAAPTMRQFGHSIEEVAAGLAVFASQGMKARRAGTRLAVAVEHMAFAALENADKWKQLNVAVFDSDNNMRNLADIVSDLEGLFGGLSHRQQLASLKQLGFTKQAAKSMRMLLGYSDTLRKFQNDLRNAEGSVDRLSSVIRNTLGQDIMAAWQSFIRFTRFLAEKFRPELRESANSVKEFFDELRGVPEEKLKRIVKIFGKLAIAGPMIWVFGKLVGMIGSLALAFIAVRASVLKLIQTAAKLYKKFKLKSLLKFFSMLAKWLAIIPALLISIYIALKSLWNNLPVLRKAWRALVDTVIWFGEVAVNAVNKVIDVIPGLRSTIDLLINSFKDLGDSLSSFLDNPKLYLEIFETELLLRMQKGQKFVGNFFILFDYEFKIFIEKAKKYWKQFVVICLTALKTIENYGKNKVLYVGSSLINAFDYLTLGIRETFFKLPGMTIDDSKDREAIRKELTEYYDQQATIINQTQKELNRKSKPIGEILKEEWSIAIHKSKPAYDEAMKKIEDLKKERDKIASGFFDDYTGEGSEMKRLEDKLEKLYGKLNVELDWLPLLDKVINKIKINIPTVEEALSKSADKLGESAQAIDSASMKLYSSTFSAARFWEQMMKNASKSFGGSWAASKGHSVKTKRAEAELVLTEMQKNTAFDLATHLRKENKHVGRIIKAEGIKKVREKLAPGLASKFTMLSEDDMLKILKKVFVTPAEQIFDATMRMAPKLGIKTTKNKPDESEPPRKYQQDKVLPDISDNTNTTNKHLVNIRNYLKSIDVSLSEPNTIFN